MSRSQCSSPGATGISGLHSRRTRGDRHSFRVEAKKPALLSSRDGYLLELTGWTQGSQASFTPPSCLMKNLNVSLMSHSFLHFFFFSLLPFACAFCYIPLDNSSILPQVEKSLLLLQNRIKNVTWGASFDSPFMIIMIASYKFLC